MRHAVAFVFGALLLLSSCKQVENKNEAQPSDQLFHDTEIISNKSNLNAIDNSAKGIFDVEKFMTLTDSFLSSIEHKNIKLNFSLDSTSTDVCIKQRFDFDPGKGNRILRLWILLSTYNDEVELNKEFNKLRLEGSDENGNDMPPGLTYSNDYVIKTAGILYGLTQAVFTHISIIKS